MELQFNTGTKRNHFLKGKNQKQYERNYSKIFKPIKKTKATKVK